MKQRHRQIWLYSGLLALCLVLAVISIVTGAMVLPLRDIGLSIQAGLGYVGSNPDTELVQFVITELRLPRTVVALLVGASLAAAGVAMQGLFRNPLADPSLVGVSSGASLGAVAVIVLSVMIPLRFIGYALPVGAFCGGILATFVVYKIATRQGRSDTSLLLLAGIAINAIAAAGIGLLSYFADDQALRDLTLWTMGSVAKTGWTGILISSPILVVCCWLLLGYRQLLNALVMGESVAFHIGHDIKKLKLRILILTTLIVSTAVSISGVIMFVGLVVPHVLRTVVGANHRHLLPLSMLFGASLLLLADIFSRLIVAPAELPIGLLMSLIGGPFFILLLLQQRKQLTIN